MPCEPPEREKIAVLMPASLPFMSTSAPPELPGLIARIGLDEELIVGDADLGARQRRDDAVGYGLPDAEGIADREHDVAHHAVRRNWRNRASGISRERLSAAIRRDRCEGPSARSRPRIRACPTSDTLTWSAPSMTWSLVTTRPEGSTITPDPSERCICSGWLPGTPKNRRKIGSSSNGLRFCTTLAA